ncbi:hypothetical protein IMX26_16270 [Clostridium sp. 'deep sea']|uniref:hypothetical protein n=1 Tax=Clostridium sp. 'deep sea' TaxID=2779445 RepID=UPI0018965E24|nr:hypothetical protein [Clostridium sp. 'deep sea']QOR34995.1 hypothetical protein IMX26_16270 [Clostridium sp. 'deep sea']
MAILQNLQSAQPLIMSLIIAVFLMHLLMEKDELQQQAFANALRSAVLIAIVGTVIYLFYCLLNNIVIVSIYSVITALEFTCIIAIVLYYLDLVNLGFRLNIRNKTLANFMLYLSVIISVIATVSVVLELKIFANSSGLLRYDELMLFANVILLSLLIPILPKRKNLGHKEFYKSQHELSKGFNLIILIYLCVFILLFTIMFINKFR